VKYYIDANVTPGNLQEKKSGKNATKIRLKSLFI
jgi:hypothetical protein